MKGLIGRLLFPPRCAACKSLLDWYEDGCGLCEGCIGAWNQEKREHCAICAKEISACSCMPEMMKKAKCGGFFKLTYYYPNTKKHVQNRVIYAIKEKRARTAFDFLAKEMQPLVEKIVGEAQKSEFCIVYLPRIRKAKRRYEVDQAEQLARALSGRTGIAIAPVLVRNGGKEQTRLTPNERMKNAQASFFLENEEQICGKCVLLVDDLVTTGAGMSAATKLCRRAGATRVYAISVASDITNREIT